MANDPFRYALLKPVRAVSASADNAAVLGPKTLGIEVTEAELVLGCGLGNIDPQHGFGAGPGTPTSRSAAEAALDWPLPPHGSTLATIRPDADAFTAMAVLAHRARGEPMHAAMLERVALVGQCDAYDYGGWAQFIARHGEIARPATARDVVTYPDDYRAMTAVAVTAGTSVADRVSAFAAWLRTGVIDPNAALSAATFADALAKAWNDGGIALEPFEGEGGAPVSVMTTRESGGLQLGYRRTPIVVAQHSAELRRTVAIAQFETGWLNLAQVAAALNVVDPGWGGSHTIIGSPQGVGTSIPLAEILAVVRAALAPNARERFNAVRGSLGLA